MARVVCVSITDESIADRIRPHAMKQVSIRFRFGSGVPMHVRYPVPLAASARRAAGIAFETGAVTHEREVSTLLARLAFIALPARFADEV